MSVTVSKGNSVYKIQSGGTDVADVVVHGGAMIVRSDGSADETLVEFRRSAHGRGRRRRRQRHGPLFFE